MNLKQLTRRLANKFGLDIIRIGDNKNVPSANETHVDNPSDDELILREVKPFTMTSDDRILAVIDSIRYLAKNGIAGSVVECGVWRGGSSMAAALTLLQEGDITRDLYLFDTFTGMTEPSDKDVSFNGIAAKEQFPSSGDGWCKADVTDVTNNMHSTGYPNELLHFIVGPVEETIASQCPPQHIALLRLDTDWYESTRHELEHLFPRLVTGGILIIDDYGHWQGARKAVDEYLSSHNLHYLMHRIDYTGRLIIKTA